MNTTTECEMEVRPSLNPDTLDKLVGQVVSDLGASVNGALVVLGDRLGIYSELVEIGPAGSQELAAKTGLDERQLREWLSAQAASGYISYDTERDAFFLSAEQAAVFADPKSPAAMTGLFQSQPCITTSRLLQRASGLARASLGVLTITVFSAA